MTGNTHGKLLLVDDEPQLLRVLRPTLSAAGWDVVTADHAEAALKAVAGDNFDVMVLDLGLPDLDGQEVIQKVRQWSDLPIVVLSARGLEDEKIRALDAGADDYVGKPFSVGELLARIRAATRGRTMRLNDSEVELGDLKIDLGRRIVSLQGETLSLTPREYDFVRALARHLGRPVTHRQLIAAIWGPAADVEPQFVRVLAAQVRQKLEADPAKPRHVLTEAGVGYRLA